jgi:type IV secretion system protein VirB8
VYTMSTPEVASGYTALHSRNNPNSPYSQYGSSRAIRVKILSIVFEGGGKGVAPKGATVRIQRSVYDKATGASRPLDSKIVTLAFTYKANLKMSENDRIENPLGFQVTAYRVDSDYASMPPSETEAVLQPAPQAQVGGEPEMSPPSPEGMQPQPDAAMFNNPDAALPAAPASPGATPAAVQPAAPVVPQR